jgi:hypothetical protein
MRSVQFVRVIGIPVIIAVAVFIFVFVFNIIKFLTSIRTSTGTMSREGRHALQACSLRAATAGIKSRTGSIRQYREIEQGQRGRTENDAWRHTRAVSI